MSAGQWHVASMAVQGLLQFAVGIVLARLLPPEDFGVVALALVTTGLASMISDMGLGLAVVQRRDLTELHLRAAFTASLLLGILIAATLVLLAPLIGRLTRSGEVSRVLQVLSLVFIATGASTVARAHLQRRLDFRTLFHVEVFSYVGGYALVAPLAALSGWGVWSLVSGSVVQGLLSSILSIAAARTSIRPALALDALRDLMHFGAGVSAASVVSYLARNGDNLLVGRLLGAGTLGLYSRAFNLMMLPLNYVCSALPNVLLPAYAAIQEDRQRVGRAFLMSVQLTSLTTMPIMAGMIVAAPHMILGLYGDNWTGSVVPLQILCVVGLPRAVHPLAGAVIRSCGRVYTELWLQLGFAFLVLTGTALGARSGLIGVAALVSVAIVAMYGAMARLVLSITGATWGSFASAQMPGVLVAGVTAGVALVMRLGLEIAGLSHLAILVVLIGASAASVVLGVYLLPPRFRPAELFDHLRASLGRLPNPLRAGLGYVLSGRV